VRAVLTFLIVLMVGGLGSPAIAADGKGLFAENCSRCHGGIGNGIRNKGPSLAHAGPAAADFYLRTGYMPLAASHDQPSRSRVLFDQQQLRALVRYVSSLGTGPPIPTPHWQTASVASGEKLFGDHCAGCHQIVARGGVVTGARVPPLDDATPRQIAEAIRVGPYLMPRFTAHAISAAQVADIVAYVQYTHHPDDPGGLAIGYLGPWPEGVVTWLIAAAALVALCLVFSRRART
jgi:ubiquinol-cytochrome c reductase cytochrome c subunit